MLRTRFFAQRLRDRRVARVRRGARDRPLAQRSQRRRASRRSRKSPAMTLSDTIDDALAWRLRLTAGALAAVGTIDTLSTGLTLIAAGGIGVALWHSVPALALAFLAAQVIVGLAAKWIAVRVRFDGVVFTELVHAVQKTGFRTEHLDRALRGIGMLPE